MSRPRSASRVRWLALFYSREYPTMYEGCICHNLIGEISVLTPRSVGLGIFAGTCVPVSIPWIAPILGTVPYGAGLVLLFLCFGNYLVDSYLLLAASVLAGGTVMRSILGVGECGTHQHFTFASPISTASC